MQLTRRTFLADAGLGFTGLALGALLFRDGVSRADVSGGRPHFAARAKRVAYLRMYGNICFDTRDRYVNFPWSSEAK